MNFSNVSSFSVCHQATLDDLGKISFTFPATVLPAFLKRITLSFHVSKYTRTAYVAVQRQSTFFYNERFQKAPKDLTTKEINQLRVLIQTMAQPKYYHYGQGGLTFLLW